MSAEVSELYRYPVKSAAGRRLEEAEVAARGFRADRRWMVVDPDGNFLTQREHTRMALLQPRVYGEHLTVCFCEPAEQTDAGEALKLQHPPVGNETMEVEVWGDRLEARRARRAADRWLREHLGVDCRLVYMPDSTLRPLDTRVGGEEDGDIVSFVDGYPFLLIGRASLEELNRRLDEPVPMDRFRPNIVVEGTEPFAEDDWQRLQIGGVEFRVAEPCTRCVITTVDQSTGEKGTEPLATLAEFRRTDAGKVAFGQYLVHQSRGMIRQGDRLRHT